MKIKRREKKKVYDLTNLKNNLDYECVNLLDYVENTQVKEVYLHISAIDAITNWSKQSVDEKKIKNTAEVGGFLLGRYEKKGTQFRTTIEVFVPAKEVDYNDRTTLEFGTQALRDLDKTREQYPMLVIIGWFHTHPGHTPYLSSFDMTIQKFFTAPYHLAIVLDTLTANFDTGIFSWQKLGKINNKPQYKKWILWKELRT